MTPPIRHVWRILILAIVPTLAPMRADAGGGFFLPAYGAYSIQMSGTGTAIGFDGLSGSTNPAKLFTAGNRLDFGVATLELYRRINREGGADPALDFVTTSNNGTFFVPQGGFAHRLGASYAFGVAMYGNGGLNTAFPGTTGIASSNQNPAACGTQAANFIGGCGKVGIDLNQLIIAPTFAWHFADHQTVGIAPLIGYQRFRAYGFEAFEPLSQNPTEVSGTGYAQAFGTGVRIGWYGEISPRLSLGAAYATRVYMQRFGRYRGLLAGGGRLDIPANYSIGVAWRATEKWVLAADVQRIEFHSIPALGNPLLNSLQNPTGKPLGSDAGSGFNWRNQINYRLGTQVMLTNAVTLLGGLSYGLAPPDKSINSVTVNVLAPTPTYSVSGGCNWHISTANELQFAYSHLFFDRYKGPSALSPGAAESFAAHVDIFWVGIARRF